MWSELYQGCALVPVDSICYTVEFRNVKHQVRLCPNVVDVGKNALHDAHRLHFSKWDGERNSEVERVRICCQVTVNR